MANEIIKVLLDFKQNLSKNINPAITALDKFQNRTETLRNAMTPLSIASAGFLTLAAKNAFDFSSSLKEAKKGLGLTNEELKAFGDQAKKVSENLNFQVGSKEIVNIATAAGKLGVAKNTLAEYTEGLVKLGVATSQLENIEDLNTNVAKINSVFKMGIPDLEKYYGAVNMLADSTSANPQELIRFTQQIAGTASASRISAKDISAWGATLIDAGQQSGEAATFLRNFSVKLGAAENQSKKLERLLTFWVIQQKGSQQHFRKMHKGQ
ncbi:MAG: phage tail tape measure protein [Richelia sp. SM1_7_0]|nr:phage tail tape measure protein [Richelia sp. SM1_7_0]